HKQVAAVISPEDFYQILYTPSSGDFEAAVGAFETGPFTGFQYTEHDFRGIVETSRTQHFTSDIFLGKFRECDVRVSNGDKLKFVFANIVQTERSRTDVSFKGVRYGAIISAVAGGPHAAMNNVRHGVSRMLASIRRVPPKVERGIQGPLDLSPPARERPA